MTTPLQRKILERRKAPETARAYQTCLRYIHRHDLQVGDKLPPQSQLFRQLGICQGTLSKALDWLVQDGVITRKQRVGTIVRARYPEKAVPPIWSVGVALGGIQWNPTFPRLAYELHRNLGRLHCRDRLYMISPRALPASEVDERFLDDFTGLAGDLGEGSLDAVVTSGRINAPEAPICHVLGWDLAHFGVLLDSRKLVAGAGRELMARGCRNPGLVTVGARAPGHQQPFEAFQDFLRTAGIASTPRRLLATSEGFDAGRMVAERLLKYAADQRPDGLIILDDHLAAGLTARLAEDGAYRPVLAVQTNRQVPIRFALPAVRFEVDLALMAERTATKLVDWLLDPTRPRTVEYIPAQRRMPAESTGSLAIHNPLAAP